MIPLGVSIGTVAAQQFIVQRLRGDVSDGPDDDVLAAELLAGPTGGRVHKIPIPNEYTFPVIGFERYGAGTDTAPIGRGMPTVLTTIRQQIKALCVGYDQSPIEAAADLIDRLLNAKANIIDISKPEGGSYGTYHVECSRESELLTELPPDSDGTVYQQLGGIYAFTVSRVG